jgi:hypothetical protein
MGLTTSSCEKSFVQKPNNQPRIVETGCRGGQGSPRAVAPKKKKKKTKGKLQRKPDNSQSVVPDLLS